MEDGVALGVRHAGECCDGEGEGCLQRAGSGGEGCGAVGAVSEAAGIVFDVAGIFVDLGSSEMRAASLVSSWPMVVRCVGMCRCSWSRCACGWRRIGCIPGDGVRIRKAVNGAMRGGRFAICG